MSYVATLVPISYFPANFAVSSVVAEMNAGLTSAAVSQAATTTAAVQTSVVTNTAVAANTAASSAVAAGTTTTVGSTSAAAAAISTVALPIAVSIMGILAAGMIIDVAKAQRELRRCHKLSIETVFSSKEKLIDALFAHSGEDECKIYEEKDGSLIVRYRLQDYFFRMNRTRGCFDLEIVNAQHPVDELEKINQIQLHYMEAVRRHSCESLMETVREQGWTIEQDVTENDGSRCISILI